MISWQHLAELFMQMVVRPKLKDKAILARFALQRNKYNGTCDLLLQNKMGSSSDSGGYDWTGWAANVRQSFNEGVPIGFLSNSTLSHTMVYSRRRGILATRNRVNWIKCVYDENVVKGVLREDYIGLPTITSIRYLTSANRAHHVYHLAQYKKRIGIDFWDCPSIIEWGGGYGNMACIIRKMSSKVTYTIIDLPELIALQYVYLSSIFGENAVNVVLNNGTGITPGRINLISSNFLSQDVCGLRCDGFLSTWALTESPKEDQLIGIERNFFDAKHILIGSMINENNFIRNQISNARIQKVNVPTGFGIGSGNEYWFR